MIDRILGLVPSWVYVAVIAFLLAIYTIQWTTSTTRIAELKVSLASEQKKHSDYVTWQIEINKAEADKARKREQELQAAADKDRNESQTRINGLRAERDRALAELRKRPSRPPAAANGVGLSKPAGPGPDAIGCTGAELYRQDAEAFLGIATDADELRIEYHRLWGLYQRARGQAAEAVKEAQK